MITNLNFNCKRLWLSLLSTPTRNLKCESYRKCYSFPWHQLLVLAMHAKIINNKFYLGSLSFSLFDFSDVMDALDLSCSDRFIFRGWATMFPARNSSNVRCTSCIHKNAYSRKVARKLWSKSINISHYTTECEEQTEDTLGPFLERPGHFRAQRQIIWHQNLLNSSTVPSSQTGQHCFINWHFHCIIFKLFNFDLECKHGQQT